MLPENCKEGEENGMAVTNVHCWTHCSESDHLSDLPREPASKNRQAGAGEVNKSNNAASLFEWNTTPHLAYLVNSLEHTSRTGERRLPVEPSRTCKRKTMTESENDYEKRIGDSAVKLL